MKLKPGDKLIHFTTEDIFGNTISTDDYMGRPLLICFFRYVECLFCSLRVHELMKNQLLLETRGLQIIAISQSPVEDIVKQMGPLNPRFALIADPERKLYKLYGVEERNIAGYLLGHFRWLKAIKAFSLGHFLKVGHGSMTLMPADFLVDANQIIVEAFYSRDISEHLPIKMILKFLKY